MGYHDRSLREYLLTSFWSPMVRRAADFERKGVRRVSEPFAGMQRDESGTPLARLRSLYRESFAVGMTVSGDALGKWKSSLAAARGDASLTARDREEVELIDAKMELRSGSFDDPVPWRSAKAKLLRFLGRSRDPALASEARGWLAHAHYKLGEQSAAGKIYLDELNRPGSNLGSETVLNSLRMTYYRNGGRKLLDQLEDYFDTAEHAEFAILQATNPGRREGPPPYAKVNALLQKHGKLFETERGARVLTLLGMRTALWAADPPGALRIAARVPRTSAVRTDPEFLWMAASARFLMGDFAGAEAPLAELFASKKATPLQRSAAAYGLCGVFRKLGNHVEQLRHALWLKSNQGDRMLGGGLGDDSLSVYWAMSGWDLGMILEVEAPVAALEEFVRKYPRTTDVRLVQYALAVRLCRERRYAESADWYKRAGAPHRAVRMAKMEKLVAEVAAAETGEPRLQAKYRLAEYMSANQERLLFNDSLWAFYQRYALVAEDDSRFTAAERATAIRQERELQDAQEESWQAYLILADIVREAGRGPTGRKAATLALTCLGQISPDRFRREKEIEAKRRDLAAWLWKRGPTAR
jgi:hypothetical protein